MRRPLLFLLVIFALTGCASDTWIYTWQRNPDHARWEGMATMPSSAVILQQDWASSGAALVGPSTARACSTPGGLNLGWSFAMLSAAPSGRRTPG